ncbi:hypothetical protein [Sunxiuqinia elliptica]|uniref:Outer membrane protein assembly factor BamA n=1 Tax=Sunxiuqinia elliptica TaxID=655355 RepID=A0A4R6GSP6_9BACT|nr:hypothetical protein [Sunxiuqinia elliptica]TDN98422.1 hypothetical protein DET52_108210 [Sunxiuqinia elliptica]TDO60525.1 hypothetical protein DET65_2335 [Sunxiuqinia elliptica]
MEKLYRGILICFLLVGTAYGASAQEFMGDSVSTEAASTEQFYDSLKHKAYRHRITRLVYDNLVSPKGVANQQLLEQELFQLNQLEGKTIASVRVQQLDIIGPSFADTSRVSHTWLGQTANRLHTQTNEKIIYQNVLVYPGDTLNVEQVLDNERIIRRLPFIKDVRFLVRQDSLNMEMVHVTVLTKDVFSFGIGGSINGLKAASLEMYNKNIWGAGHEISGKIVGHVDREPYVGFESNYTINNIGGNFLNISLGYADTYERHGGALVFEKEFLRTTTKWGGGLTAARWKRADRLIDDGPIILDFDLDYRYYDAWGGYAFQLNKDVPYRNKQLVWSGRMRFYDFFKRPEPDIGNRQYFADSKFYLTSLSLSKRSYYRDYLIYSYGITEDIPKGYLHELVIGYDDNEFTDRLYSHLYFSSGNFIRYKPSFLFASAGIGGFFGPDRFEQGQIEVNGSYISRLYPFGRKSFRQFIKLNYILGIRRFDVENLFLNRDYGIRGFNSDEPAGKQRLTLSFESVLFSPKKILDFNFAFFGFVDVGVIGSNKHLVFTQDYYAGVGAGVRIRNENLVFRTLQLRLSFYPNHPADIGGLGAVFNERSKTQFYSFQPRKPDMLRFE